MKKNAVRDMGKFLFLIGALLTMAFAVTCGGGGDSTPTGTVKTTISDPPTCKSPNGPFDNVWVTITRVRAHTSNSAAQNDSGWVDLIDPFGAPKQIDLLSLDSTTCVFTQLGLTNGIPVGQYQQIRLYLLSNSAGPGEVIGNKCTDSNSYNCVVLTGATTTEALNLSSEVQNGIKIPSGQIAGGKFTVQEGQVIDLNIDFDACASIVQQPNGQYRLKPVLHAGEILNINWIRGQVVENGTPNGIPNALVLIEQKDSEGIDRVIMQKFTDSDGKFIFCPLSTGTYDVVAGGKNGGLIYVPTITLGVEVGTAMGPIPLFQATGTGSANISGQVTAQITPSGEIDIDISALQNATPLLTPSLLVTVPVLQGLTPTTVTTVGGTADYSLTVPTGTPRVGTFISGGTPYSPVVGDYLINAQTTNCPGPSLLTPSLSVVPGGNYSAPGLAFTGCTPN